MLTHLHFLLTGVKLKVLERVFVRADMAFILHSVVAILDIFYSMSTCCRIDDSPEVPITIG